MTQFHKILSAILILGILFTACKKAAEEEIIIKGCKDPIGDNYNPKAVEDDGSCTYQKRFISKYDINVLCNQASSIFQDASMEITENTKKDRVNFNIGSLAGNIIFNGAINKNDVVIDTVLMGLVVNTKAINQNFEELNIKANVTLKAKFTLDNNAQKLTGDMDVTIINAEDIVVSNIPIPAGMGKFTDVCAFKGIKK